MIEEGRMFYFGCFMIAEDVYYKLDQAQVFRKNIQFIKNRFYHYRGSWLGFDSWFSQAQNQSNSEELE